MKIYPWQQKAWKNLISQYHIHRLPQALLLSGQKGIGKFDLAFAFSNVLLCTSPKERACLACDNCRLFHSHNHPDFYALKPENNVIKIDQIRTLIEYLSKTPKLAHRQVVVIQCAEKMNASASNALLKTLEEPPGDVIFLLTSAKQHRLPMTILSRCQNQPCIVEKKDIGFKWLFERISNKATAQLLWRITDAAPLLALDLFENKYLKIRDTILKGMQDILQKKQLPIHISKITSTLNMKHILNSWIILVIDLWQLKQQVSSTYITNQDQIDTLNQLSGKLEVTLIERFYTVLLEAMAAEQANLNLNQMLVLDNLWIQFAHCIVI